MSWHSIQPPTQIILIVFDYNRYQTLSTNMPFIWISIMLANALAMMGRNDTVVIIGFRWWFFFNNFWKNVAEIKILVLNYPNIASEWYNCMTYLVQLYDRLGPDLDRFDLLLRFQVRQKFEPSSAVVALIPLVGQELVFRQFLSRGFLTFYLLEVHFTCLNNWRVLWESLFDDPASW